jgi:alpha-tubulin suppressor-like RCC1 family protein
MNRPLSSIRPRAEKALLFFSRAAIPAAALATALSAGTASAATPPPGERPAAVFASGTNHSCALSSDGDVLCWGQNSYGQLGDGTTGNHLVPTAIPNFGYAVSLAAGDAHTCALDYDGTVYCWGDNSVGQLGTGSYAQSSVPVAVTGIGGSSQPAIALTAGATHTCALLADGTVKCWGGNARGEVGDGTTTNRNAPVTAGTLAGIVSLSAGAEHTCAIDTVGKTYCWGANTNGQIGDNTTTNRLSPVPVSGIASGNSRLAIGISAGRSHTCALVLTGPSIGGASAASSVVCWGANGRGQLGSGGSSSDSLVPVAVSGVSNVKGISVNGDHGCALSAGGTVQCWGENTDGEAGNGTTGNYQNVPVSVSSLTGVRALSAGYFHSCAVLSNGTAKCWGGNLQGQLGNNSFTAQSTPGAVSGLSSISIAGRLIGGGYHSCGVEPDGTLKCWGYNFYGAVGDGTTTQRSSAVPVGISDVIDVCTGAYHTCALLVDGTVKCWGLNSSGQAGTGSTSPTSILSPGTSVSGVSNAVGIACGGYHACANLANGTMKCWGYGVDGELGNGSTVNNPTPVQVSNAAGAVHDYVRAAAGGTYHTCSIRAGGQLQCWGYNSNGQIGDGTVTSRSTPATVTLLSGLTPRGIGLGGWHSCALAANGSPQCWGYNGYGQLGNNTTTQSLTPVSVSGMSGVPRASGVVAGYYHSCAMMADSSFECWGYNAYGQLGNGTTTNRSTPGVVSWIWYGTSLTAGGYHTCASLTDGTGRCWGMGTYGELGNGNTSGSTLATSVVGFP